jgi:D-cysteine desulfhydrase
MTDVSVVPRARLAVLPTPLLPAPLLSDALGFDVWLKRDDLTGLGLGGNKVRALEYLIGDAQVRGADCIVTGGGPSSNWVMLAALAGVTHGLDVHIAYFGPPVGPTGNLVFVDRLPGVHYEFTGDETRSSVDPLLETIRARLEAEGRRPYVIGRGGASPIGALGYLTAVEEIEAQLGAAGFDPSVVWTATGSCGTQAGLVAGYSRTGRERKVIGVSVHRPVDECRDRIGAIATAALGGSVDLTDEWAVEGGQLGRGNDRALHEAAILMACTEGVFLDPEFGAPALAELIVRPPAASVLFLVTGGAPTLFDHGVFA